VLAFLAYIPTIIIILLNWSNASWVGLVHPIVNGLMGNGAVILLVLFKRTFPRNLYLIKIL
jgi:hypothetical protein